MHDTALNAGWRNFLGQSPDWYKKTILAFLIINPLLFELSPAIAGWALVAEFIFTLAMALQCYPLQPGGLITLEAVLLGMTSAGTVADEVLAAFPVILLLVFMVAGIYFMRELLLFTFTRLLLGVRSKSLLALLFCAASAFLSAFLDALTVIAVVISVAVGFYSVYHKVASGKQHHDDHDHGDDQTVHDHHREDLERFRGLLRSLLMHAAVGSALGGVTTMVGEPQNLLIAAKMDWDFASFFWKMVPVTMPVLVVGLVTCLLLEKTGSFGYGDKLPSSVRTILEEFNENQRRQRTRRDVQRLIVQAIAAVFLIVALALHLAEIGLIGLTIIVFQTAFNGVTDEHQIGRAFQEALPFTALLVVFFGVVGVIHDQHLFVPLIEWVLHQPIETQPGVFYIANGVLSAISDNVFVATIYINEVLAAYQRGIITREHMDLLAVAINTGTNIPSVATPNGQAAFLFLLTSSIAPLIRLSYMRMVVMALPYTIVMSITGWLAIVYLLH
ncbi:MAG: sodium/proton antiporter NhaB [Gammaproteobacteria bacterium]|nr:sodium/proton antiporter NhaB [Gammaproteobacteria bacterium]